MIIITNLIINVNLISLDPIKVVVVVARTANLVVAAEVEVVESKEVLVNDDKEEIMVDVGSLVVVAGPMVL